MRSSGFAAVACGAGAVAALDLFGLGPREQASWIARQTLGVADMELGEGLSPAPTPAPQGHGQMELVKRLSGFTLGKDTCGYIASSNSNAFTCVKVDASCTNDKTFMGCCSTTGTDCHTGLKQKCIPYSQSASLCKSLSDFHTLCCSSSEKPECHTYKFSTTASPNLVMTLLACQSAKGSGTLLDYPPAFTKTSGSTSKKSTSSSTQSSSSSLSTTSSASSTTTGPAAPTDAPPPAEPAQATPVGAIVGGTVGGVAVIGAAALAIFFLRRREKAKDDSSAASTVTGPMQPAPIGGPGNGSKFFYSGQGPGPAASIMSGTTSHHHDARYSVVPPVHSPMSPHAYEMQGGMYDPHASTYGYPPGQQPPGPYGPHSPPPPVGGPYYAGTPPPQQPSPQYPPNHSPQYPPQHGPPPPGGYQPPQAYGQQYR